MKLENKLCAAIPARSADCQSAVSQIGNLRALRSINALPNSIRRYGRLAICVTLFAFVPSPLFACAACYGKSDSPLASGMNAGIFTLLGVVLTVLTCFAVFFVHVVRGEAKAQTDNPAPNPPPQDPPKV